MTISESKNRINDCEQQVNNEYAALVATTKSVGSAFIKECSKKEDLRVVIIVVLWVVSFYGPTLLAEIGLPSSFATIIGISAMIAAFIYSIYYYFRFKKGHKPKASAVAKRAFDNLMQEINGYQQYFK